MSLCLFSCSTCSRCPAAWSPYITKGGLAPVFPLSARPELDMALQTQLLKVLKRVKDHFTHPDGQHACYIALYKTGLCCRDDLLTQSQLRTSGYLPQLLTTHLSSHLCCAQGYAGLCICLLILFCNCTLRQKVALTDDVTCIAGRCQRESQQKRHQGCFAGSSSQAQRSTHVAGDPSKHLVRSSLSGEKGL